MHGPKHSTTFTRILALDLGKFNSVACVYDAKTHEHSFTSIATTPQTVHDLLAKHQTARCIQRERNMRWLQRQWEAEVSVPPYAGLAPDTAHDNIYSWIFVIGLGIVAGIVAWVATR